MHLIKLFRNNLEDKDADGRKNNETKTEAKKDIAYESAFIYLKSNRS